MLMLSRRLQILIDDERYARLEAQARERGTSVATIVREAIDAAAGSDKSKKRRAASRILDAAPMPVPELDALKAELAELRERRK